MVYVIASKYGIFGDFYYELEEDAQDKVNELNNQYDNCHAFSVISLKKK